MTKTVFAMLHPYLTDDRYRLIVLGDIWTKIVKVVVVMSEAKKSKILTAARSVFLRYGFKRVSMNDIAEAADVSRPALYVLFKNKEEIFVDVFMQWVTETIASVKSKMDKFGSPEQKLMCAFEIWTVRPFEMMMKSPEAKELIDCSFEFSQESLRNGYGMFEAAIVPVVASLAERRPARANVAPERIAHVLASAVRGFKHTADKPAELRRLIEELLALSFSLDSDALRPKSGSGVARESRSPESPEKAPQAFAITDSTLGNGAGARPPRS